MTVDGAKFGPPAPFEPPAWVAEGLGRPTGKGLLVGVIDSGWDRACDDPRVLPGVGLVDPADDLAMLRTDDDHDRVGHGTACIHQILRIAPDAQVVPIRVFGKDLETSPGTLQAGILYAIERGVNVVNLSLGTTLEGTLHPLYAACEKARRQGIIIVAAGHNSRDWSYPAIFENVIGVSAARFGSAYDFRYHADEAMECQAWGIEQPVVWLNGEEQIKHGTSFAAPNITGIVCLLLERHPGATLEQVRDLLAEHAMEVVDPVELEAVRAKAKAGRLRVKAEAAQMRARLATAKSNLAQAKAELAQVRAELAEARAKAARGRPKPTAEPPMASPTQPEPTRTEPAATAPAPVESSAKPVKAAPVEAAPVEAAPKKAAAVKTAPAKTAPVKAKSTGAGARADASKSATPTPKRRARAPKSGKAA